jgi:hypothetical protein
MQGEPDFNETGKLPILFSSAECSADTRRVHSNLSALLAVFEDFGSFSCLGDLNRSGTTIALAFYIENFIGAVS